MNWKIMDWAENYMVGKIVMISGKIYQIKEQLHKKLFLAAGSID